MSANELFEWIFDDSGLNFGSNLQNDTLSFRKTYDNSRLIDDTDNYYNVDSNDYQSIIYTDLESIFSGNSFTLSLTLFEKFDDPTKPGNLFTLGYHTKGSKNTCITVGRKANTGEVVLGTISEFTSIKGTALGSTRQISDESYEYVLVHNNLEIERNRFHLYINRTGTSDYSLICDSSGLSNISILQPKLFIGSSLWTDEPEWNNQFDLCDVTLTSNIRLTVNETIYPVDVVVVDSITEQNLDLTTPTIGNSDIYLDERFSVSFKSDFRFSPLKTFIYVTSTTDYNRIQLQYDSLMFDNILMKYEYVFNGTITDTYNSDTVISYMFNLNGTIYNNKFATVSTQLTVKSTPSSPPQPPPPLPSVEIHSLANPGWEKIVWPDGSFIIAQKPNFPTGAEIVLKTPHTLVNVTLPGYMHQVIALDNYTIGLDTENKLYVQGSGMTQSLLIYNFMVDGTATTFPDNWRGGGGSKFTRLFLRSGSFTIAIDTFIRNHGDSRDSLNMCEERCVLD